MAAVPGVNWPAVCPSVTALTNAPWQRRRCISLQPVVGDPVMVLLSRDLALCTIVVVPVICKWKRVPCVKCISCIQFLYGWMIRICGGALCVCVCACMHVMRMCVYVHVRVRVRVHALTTGCRYICRMHCYYMFHTREVCTNLHHNTVHCSMCKCVQSYVHTYVRMYNICITMCTLPTLSSATSQEFIPKQ